jgi:hypothetical protein
MKKQDQQGWMTFNEPIPTRLSNIELPPRSIAGHVQKQDRAQGQAWTRCQFKQCIIEN